MLVWIFPLSQQVLATAWGEFRGVPAGRQEELGLGSPDSQASAASLGTCRSQLQGVCCYRWPSRKFNAYSVLILSLFVVMRWF